MSATTTQAEIARYSLGGTSATLTHIDQLYQAYCAAVPKEQRDELEMLKSKIEAMYLEEFFVCLPEENQKIRDSLLPLGQLGEDKRWFLLHLEAEKRKQIGFEEIRICNNNREVRRAVVEFLIRLVLLKAGIIIGILVSWFIRQ